MEVSATTRYGRGVHSIAYVDQTVRYELLPQYLWRDLDELRDVVTDWISDSITNALRELWAESPQCSDKLWLLNPLILVAPDNGGITESAMSHQIVVIDPRVRLLSISD